VNEIFLVAWRIADPGLPCFENTAPAHSHQSSPEMAGSRRDVSAIASFRCHELRRSSFEPGSRDGVVNPPAVPGFSERVVARAPTHPALGRIMIRMLMHAQAAGSRRTEFPEDTGQGGRRARQLITQHR